jgi:hypothetical protein
MILTETWMKHFYENAAIKTKNLLQHCIEGKKKKIFSIFCVI